MDEILISPTTSGSPPAICGNGGAGFAVLWSHLGNSGIKGRILSAGGQPGDAVFDVTASEAGMTFFPAATRVTGFAPGFAVVWLTDTPRRNVMLRTFGPDGRPLADPRQVNTTDADLEFAPAIAQSPGVGVLVCWISSNPREGVRARFFPTSGQFDGEFQVNDVDEIVKGPLALTRLDDGGFAFAWRGGPDESSANTTARVRVFNADRRPLGPQSTLDFFGFRGEMAAAFISEIPPQRGDHFAIAHTTRVGATTQQGLAVSIRDPEGRIGSFSLTEEADRSVAHAPAAGTLPGSAFVVTWAERLIPDAADGTGENIRAQRCGEQGAILSQPVQVNTTAGMDQDLPCVAVGFTSDPVVPRVGFAWIEDGKSVKARVLDSDLRTEGP